VVEILAVLHLSVTDRIALRVLRVVARVFIDGGVIRARAVGLLRRFRRFFRAFRL
jgi:hypothetical protein